MNFGEAIELVKEGGMIQRTGWNGNGLFVFMQVPSEIPHTVIPGMQSLPDSVKDEFIRRLNDESDNRIDPEVVISIRYDNQLALVDRNNLITGWSPSTSDALAEDWVEYTPYTIDG